MNIPVARLRAQVHQASVLVRVFGVTYRVSRLVRSGHTIIAVHVGGAIVPSAVAIYLVCHDHLQPGALLATVLVAALVFAFARPVPGVGIVTPALLPPGPAPAGTSRVDRGRGNLRRGVPDRAGRRPAGITVALTWR